VQGSAFGFVIVTGKQSETERQAAPFYLCQRRAAGGSEGKIGVTDAAFRLRDAAALCLPRRLQLIAADMAQVAADTAPGQQGA